MGNPIVRMVREIVLITLYKGLSAFSKKTETVFISGLRRGNGYGNLEIIEEKMKEKGVNVKYLHKPNSASEVLNAIFVVAKAKVLVIDTAFCLPYIKVSKKTKVVQVWHAAGAYKKVGLDAIGNTISIKREYRRIERLHRNIDFFIVSSPYVGIIYAKAFGLRKEQCIPLGTPRISLLMDRSKGKKEKLVKRKLVILYAPTFRLNENGQRVCPDLFDVGKIKLELEKKYESVEFMYKQHPTIIRPVAEKPLWKDVSSEDYISVLLMADVLITDYSSILFDFVAMNKKIICYIPDLTSYLKTNRGLYINPTKEFPGCVALSEEELKDKIINIDFENFDVNKIFEKYLCSCNDNTINAVADFLMKI